MARRSGKARGTGRRRRRRRRTLAVVLIAGALAYGGWRLTHSSLFELTRITVVGTRTLSPDAVVAASGLRVGQPMLGLDLDAVARELAARLPRVRTAQATRDGSTRVRIVVEERTPAVLVRTSTGDWLADRDDRFLRPADGDGSGLPVIRLEGGGALAEGAADAVRSIWAAMPDERRHTVEWFEAPALSDIRFVTGGVLVVLGSGHRIEDKLEAAALVMRRIEREGGRLVSIDVRAPDRPSARLA